MVFYFLFFIFYFFGLNANVLYPKIDGKNSHFLYFKYQAKVVYHLDIYYDTHPLVVYFDENENIKTIYASKPDKWKIINGENRIYLKPLSKNGNTNLTIVTDNKSTKKEKEYFFELEVKDDIDEFDERVPLVLRFQYPQYTTTENNKSAVDNAIIKFSTTQEPDFSEIEKFDFNYTVSGNDNIIMPSKIFNDGNFTYLEFDNPEGIIPAIFSVNEEAIESPVDSKRMGKYIVIRSINSILTLRRGAQTVCVFYETLLSMKKNSQIMKRDEGFFKRFFK
jgi:type IV secretion system protein VirB9